MALAVATVVALAGLAGPIGAASDHAAKSTTAAAVYEDLVRAIGDGRTAPALRIAPRSVRREVQIAWFSAAEHAVLIEEGAYDVCASLGADSLAALAVLLGHELAHFYGDHDWPGDFGNGFADLEVGRQLRDHQRQQAFVYETQADVFGGYYGYVAGYNTFGVAPRLLSELYRVFELGDEIPGYPGLGERQEIARGSQAQLEQLIPVFDAAHHLLVAGQHLLAAASFDFVARDFPSREILNNAGVAFALEASTTFTATEAPFALPFEVDGQTRLRLGSSRGHEADPDRRERLLQSARARFEQARHRDPSYAPALVNLACLDVLQGLPTAASARLDEALSLADAAGDEGLRADARIVRSLLLWASDAQAAAAELRAVGERGVAPLNLAILEGRRPAAAATLPPGVRETPVGPGSETYAAIVAEPVVVSLDGVRLEGGTPLLMYRDLGDRHGYVFDDGQSSVVLVAAAAGHGGRTARGVAIGDGRDAVVARYGEAPRVVNAVRGIHLVFPPSRIAFRVVDGRVAGWLQIHIDEALEPRPQQRPSFGPRVALVIGNDGYAQAPLQNAVSDAVAMARLLSDAGFEVIQRVDADRRALTEAIRLFGEQLQRRGGVGLFYYAGHGVQVDGYNYLVPLDNDIRRPDEVADEAVAVDRVLRKMKAADNDVNILMLDACRNNPYSGTRSGGTGLAPLNVDGTFVLYAAAAGQVAADAGDGEHGVFTQALLDHLLEPGQSITELSYAVRNDVLKQTSAAQNPWVETSLTGPFYFVPEGTVMGPREDRGFAAQPETAAVDAAVWASAMVPVDQTDLLIDRHEVTNAQFAAFLNQHGNRVEDGAPWLEVEDEHARIAAEGGTFVVRPGFQDHPVTEVSWHGAVRFCQWRGARLPARVEWERAAAGITLSGLTSKANFAGATHDGYERTAPVGSYVDRQDDQQALDLAGNVWEWVSDQRGTERITLGGSWYNDVEWFGQPQWVDAAQPNELTGFRCVRDGSRPANP
jgi:formylglycine-generating enzyme required for sulfatase activity